MNEEEWKMFFELMTKITNLDGGWREKRQLVEEKAAELEFDIWFEEFVGWFDSD